MKTRDSGERRIGQESGQTPVAQHRGLRPEHSAADYRFFLHPQIDFFCIVCGKMRPFGGDLALQYYGNRG